MNSIRAITRKLAAASALFLALLCAQPAAAGPFEDALPKLAADSFADTADAIAAIAASGHADAEAVISGISAGRVLFDPATKSVYLRAADGSAKNLATGASETVPASARAVRQNNRIRTTIDAALGTLRLMSPDPQKRLAAASAVFKSRDASSLKLLDEALGKETDPRVKKVLVEARAAILIVAPNASEKDRIAAIQTIAAKGDNDALALLRAVPANAPPDVKAAAASAISGVERSLAFWEVGQNVWYGLSLGSVLLLAAIGLAITFGVMGVINMAHGEFIMMGAYTAYVVQLFVPDYTLSLLIALPLAFAVTFGAGVAMERLVIRWLYHRPLETLLATFGISIALQQLAKNIFGTQARPLTAPEWLNGAWQFNDVVGISYIRIAIFVLALVFLVLLLFVLKRTRLGLEVRAVTQNPGMAASMGINPDRINMLTFGLGSGIAGIAGVAIGLYAQVTSEMGANYIVQSFMTVVVGGVGNVWGTLAGATLIGFLQKGIEWFNPSNTLAAQTYMILFIIIFIQFRPRGIVALKGRAAGA